MKTILRLTPVPFLFSIIFLSCNTNNPSSGPLAAFLVVHTSPDAPNLDVYAGSSLIITDMAYSTSTTYFGAAPNIYNFQFAGAATSNILLSDFINFDGGKGYSIFVIDSLSKLKLSIANDEFAAPSGDSVLLRFLHFSPNAGTLDLVINGGDTLYLNRSFNDNQVSSSLDDFIAIPSGTYILDMRDAGTSNIAYSTTVNLTAGNVYTLYAKGFRGSGVPATDLGLGIIQNN